MDSSASVIRLQVQKPGTREFEVEIPSGNSIRIGRHVDNDIVIEDSRVSRYHAVISASETGIVISDLSSLNGTFVNGKRISAPVTLQGEDIVLIGETRIQVNVPKRWITADQTGQTQAVGMQVTAVTILVADVCSYTYLSEHLPAADVTSMLNEWFGVVSTVVERHGGVVDKYVGDCVMALWRDDSQEATAGACSAVRAAKELVERTAELSNSKSWSRFSATTPWRCKVAINTGEALIGTVGQGGAREYAVLGDAVNIAFRLDKICSKAGYNLVFTDATANHLGSEFRIQNLGSEILEGKTAAVKLFTLA